MFPNISEIGSGNIFREHIYFRSPKSLCHTSEIRKKQAVWRIGSRPPEILLITGKHLVKDRSHFRLCAAPFTYIKAASLIVGGFSHHF